MYFQDRTEAGKLLAEKLKQYQNKKDVVVYALPRGGIITAVEIAKYLFAPLDLIIARKIGHPHNPEYAIAATAENGNIIGTRKELMEVDEEWFEDQLDKQRQEVARKKEKYLQGEELTSPKNKIAILVDDGVATGLTLRVGMIELKHHNPKKLIVAAPIIPEPIAQVLLKEADEVVALETPSEDTFLNSVGAYYKHFNQITDEEVITLLNEHKARMHETSTNNLKTRL